MVIPTKIIIKYSKKNDSEKKVIKQNKVITKSFSVAQEEDIERDYKPW